MNDNSPQQREMNRDQTQDVKKQAPGSGKDERIESKAAVKNGVARMILVVLSILIEVIVIFLLLHYAGSRAGWIYVVLHIISILLVLVIYDSHKTASIRMTWIMLIMLVPVVGTVLYFLIGLNGHTLKMRRRYVEIDKILLPMLPDNKMAEQRMKSQYGRFGGVVHYIRKNAGYPVYENTKVTYYDDGLKGFEAQKEELAKAERFIFME